MLQLLEAALLVLLLSYGTARGGQLWSSSSGDRSYSLDGSLKWTTLLSRASADTATYPERWSSASLWRGRLALSAQPRPWLRAEVAYEQRARTVTEGAGAAGGEAILVADIRAPYRLAQIESPLVEVGRTFSYRHELDRMVATLRAGRSEVKVGRQALGWGRGLYFSAIDLFAPFTPLEADREWRRGIDAVRVTSPVGDLVALEAVAATDESLETSALAARLQGYAGNTDVELIAGRRREDWVVGVAGSSPIGQAEVHLEAAVFLTPESHPDGSPLGRDDATAKVVVGGSRSFDIAGELLVLAEYHYSGFGVTDIGDAQSQLEDPDRRQRYRWGDTQLLGRHAGAVQMSVGMAWLTPISVAWVFSPRDGSGVIMPSVSWPASDNLTLAGTALIGHGTGTRDGSLRSEYGATPTSGLLQISFYY
ncbi:hypothetical protein ACFL6X_06260 [Candidatus Latescibacterota bacterium]